MIDEPRDEELNDEPGDEEAADDEGTPAAPPPQTWAGRARAGEEQDEAEEGDEFERVEAELSADLAGEEPHPADEQEEPPAAVEFEEGTEETAAATEDEATEDETTKDEAPAPEEEAPKPGEDTAEVDTLAIADREAKQEAAHAGLRARAEKSAAGRVAETGAKEAVAGAVAALPESGAGEPPKRNVWWRFLAASFVIIASTASATAIAFLLFLTDIGNDLKGDESFAAAVNPTLADVEGGAPQTILILGSDKRTGTGEKFGRSDTTMLLRVDPEKEFLALLSIPRDLAVEIPGYGTDKLNAAYSLGGAPLTLKTVQELLGIEINHIVNVDFEGFYDAINAIGCVYIDVDRHYFNPVGGEYDDIDIEAGYTKLCGYRALDYVRYRHNDNDLVRGDRQQAFVREARQQIPPKSLLPPPFGDAELIDIFTEYTNSDIDDPPTIIDMLKSFVDVRNAPVRQVSLGELTGTGTGVGTSNEDVEAAVDQFLGNDLEEPETTPVEPAPDDEPKKDKKDKPDEEPTGPALVDATGTAQQYAQTFQNYLRRRKASLPVFYPTALIANPAAAVSSESRAHIIEPPEGTKNPLENPYWGYKYVLPYQESFGLSYYGVTGVNWTDPPILNNPSEVREVDGRDYLLFYEKDRLRLVAWTTDDGAYWVINTLTRALSEEEMLAVATSTREFDG